MRTCIRLPNRQLEPLPPELAGEELRFPPELVCVFLGEHTRAGGVVLDPFAGFGTVLAVAEEMGRRAYGIELDAGRVGYARSRLRDPESLVHGDARWLASYGFPQVDFCMTGIPFTPTTRRRIRSPGTQRRAAATQPTSRTCERSSAS